MVVVVVALASLLAGCVETASLTCAEGRICPAGYVCDDVHAGCAQPAQVTACAGTAELGACSYPGVSEGACFDGVCLPAGCGNGVVIAPEVCDDRNRLHGDGCSADCLSNETCGNSVIDAVKGEACDDGNTVDGDGCQATCAVPACGDGVIDAVFNEGCDQGAANSNQPDAACRPNCQPLRCGDGVIDTGELCDDGNVVAGDGCSADCKSSELCGNGYVDLVKNEQCDDGNNANGDGCQGNCKAPYCGDGIKDTSLFEDCDNGVLNSNVADACRPTCRLPRCGDTVVDSTETCDDGNQASADGCSFDCESNETCGNDYVDFSAGEQCDDGDTQNRDGCGTCQEEQLHWRHEKAQTPIERNAHAMAYDAARCVTIMFAGGVPGLGAVPIYNDTWSWDGAAWHELTPTGSPPARFYASMAYDAARDRVVMFGGINTGAARFNDTWEWSGTAWIETTPASGNPPPRSQHGMAYDAARKKVVLFGGFGGVGLGGTPLFDTWEWNGTAWTQITPSSIPTASGAMAYDARRGRVVMFASDAKTWAFTGTTWTDITPASGNPSASGPLVYDVVRDRIVMVAAGRTWEWNGAAWSDVTPTAPNPVSLSGHQLTYDLLRQRVVLWGGFASPERRANTWEWDGSSWKDVSPQPPTPFARFGEGMAYDSARARIVIFGGAASIAASFADTWLWDGTSWSDGTPATGSPPGRVWPALAYDPVRSRVVMFGGVTGSTYRNDTWEWDGTAWNNVTPASGNPVARKGHSMVYDAARARVVMFGGTGGSTFFNDTWEWNGSGWTNVTPASGSPPTRWAHSMAYDSARSRVVMFGGLFGSFVRTDETWEWDGSTWSNVTPSVNRPAARAHAAMAYDSARARVVLFGGNVGDGVAAAADTWEWNGSSWSSIGQLSGNPPGRMNHAMVFEPAGGEVVLFGGYNGISFPTGAEVYRDVWGWDGSGWKDRTPLIAAPRVRETQMAYDPARGNIVLFGGYHNEESLTDETWLWDGRAWLQATPATSPSPRGGHALAYDIARSRLVLFGGYGDSETLADTWEWDGITWTDVTPSGTSPPPRYYHSMTYDAVRQKVILFGGNVSPVVFGDMWEWNGTSWTEVTVTPGQSPSARYWSSMTYDPLRDRVVLFGGTDASFSDTAEVWEWNGTAWTDRTPEVSPQAVAAHTLVFDRARGRVLLVGHYSTDDVYEWDGTAWALKVAANAKPGPRFYSANAYDDARGQVLRYAGEGSAFDAQTYDTWTLGFTSTVGVEACDSGLDGDGDGVTGCLDADCFAFCTPACNPTMMTCSATAPRCGDGSCQPIENARLCPADCGAPTAACGDFLCDSAETQASCPGDCTP